MKTKWWTGILLLAAALAQAQTSNLTALLQQGLFEEQASRNLDAAIADYQTLAAQFDKDRQFAATAVFRLGECYRAQGRTNEAAAQYQRILRDFADQQTLATLSRQDLTGMGMAQPDSGKPIERPGEASVEASSLAAQISGIENLKSDWEEQARAMQAIFPDEDLKNMLLQLPKLQKQEADLKANQIKQRVNFILGIQQARLKVLQSAEGFVAAPNGAWNNTASGVIDEEAREISRIQTMIQNSPDLINAPGGDGNTPLAKAAFSGWLKVAAFLLDHGADLTAGGSSALNQAATAGNRAMVEFLLSRGANVNSKGSFGKTPLLTAVQKKFPAVAEVLLANKADVNAQDDFGDTPLGLAAANGQVKLVQALLAAGANPNLENKHSQTPFSVAAASGSPEIVKLFLAAKGDPNGGKMDAPLLAAIYSKDAVSAELLLQAGANPNVKGQVHWQDYSSGYQYGAFGYGWATPLWLAVRMNQFPMVQLLLKFKADPDDSQIAPQPVLFSALPDTNMLEALLEAGGKVEARQSDGWTLLDCAVAGKNLTAVQLLLKFKADPNDSQINGQPVLFRALSDTNMLEALLAGGAKIESHDETSTINGDRPDWTPLAAAAWQPSVADAEILLNHGADPNRRDAVGNVALHWAVSFLHGQLTEQNREMVELLLDHGADPNVRNHDGSTPLDWVKRRLEQAGSPSNQAIVGNIADLLRQHGALDKLPNWDRIAVSRPAANFTFPIFVKGTNDWNQFTLLECILNFYESSELYWIPGPNGTSSGAAVHSWLLFPDLTRVVIVRPSRGSTNETRIVVNLLNSTNGIDVAKDVPLEFGDVVEIPERDHSLGDSPVGLTSSQAASLEDYLKGNVQLVVRNQKVELPFYRIGNQSTLGAVLNQPAAQKLLLASSDLAHVKISRLDPKTGKQHEWILNCSQPQSPSNGSIGIFPHPYPPGTGKQPTPDLLLRDGDVMEVPEKQ